MKTLTLHQPWASLIAMGVKKIETRSWGTKYRGPLAIHAGQHRPPHMNLPPLHSVGRTREEQREANRHCWMVIDTITDPAFMGPLPTGKHVPKRAKTPTLFHPHAGPFAHAWDREAGTDCIEQGSAVYLPLGAVVATCFLDACMPIVGPGGRGDNVFPHLKRYGDDVLGIAWVEGAECEWLEDQLPYGDYRDGRYAWVLKQVQPLAVPIPALGKQGLWKWEVTAPWEQRAS